MLLSRYKHFISSFHVLNSDARVVDGCFFQFKGTLLCFCLCRVNIHHNTQHLYPIVSLWTDCWTKSSTVHPKAQLLFFDGAIDIHSWLLSVFCCFSNRQPLRTPHFIKHLYPTPSFICEHFVTVCKCCCCLLFQCASVLLCWRMERWHTTCKSRRVSTKLSSYLTAAYCASVY